MRGFYWERHESTKAPRPWTPRRLAAAQRAVDREAEKMALFPELRRIKTVEERQAEMDEWTNGIIGQVRQGRARQWWTARAYLRELPATERERLLAKWQTRFTPGTPSYLLSVARMMSIDPPPPNPLTSA